MNRRTFLTLTGITILGLPSLSIAKEKRQWIKLLEQQPDIGRRILLINRYDRPSYEKYDMTGGIVLELDLGLSNKNHNSLIRMKVDFLTYGQNPVYIGAGTTSGKEVMASRKWCVFDEYDSYHPYVNNNGMTIHTRTEYLANYYWMDVDKGYPIDIPPFPKYVSPWRSFVDFTPYDGTYIEIRDQIGQTAIGKYKEPEGVKEWSYVIYNKESAKRLSMQGVGVNKKYWHWRHVS